MPPEEVGHALFPQLNYYYSTKNSLITSYPMRRLKEFDSLPGSDSEWLHSHSNVAHRPGREKADYDPPPLGRLMVTAEKIR